MADDVFSIEHPQLPPAVEALVVKIRYKNKQANNGPLPRLQTSTRMMLAELGETESLVVLGHIYSQTVRESFDAFICLLVNQPMLVATGEPYSSCYTSPPAAPLAASFSASYSPLKRCALSLSPPHSPSPAAVKLLMTSKYHSVPVPRKLEDDFHDHLTANGGPVTPMGGLRELQSCKGHHTTNGGPLTLLMGNVRDHESRKVHMTTNGGLSAVIEDLWNLEFRKAFLILNYLGGYDLEGLMTADHIRQLGSLTMKKFEEEVWGSIGQRCLGDEKHRVKTLDWDSKKPHVYHCIVEHNHANDRLNISFKGPFVANMRNFLQTTMGDDHVLLVRFSADNTNDKYKCNHQCLKDKHMCIIDEGIHVGPYHYRFFVFKDGQKEEKKKDPTSSPVKCYFIRMEDGKSIREVRSFFMNADTLQNSSTYMARFSLILSKTMKLNLDLANVTIICVPDIPCKDGDGNDTYDNRGKPLIYTDGTGFISEDLASLCPDVSQGRCLDSYIEQNHEVNFSDRLRQPPLLMQVRLFFSGSTIKGTLLVNKKLQPRTIVVRDSMVKVRPYENLSNNATANSLEIVNTSRRPKPADLSRNLIMLLSYGGVPGDFFMDLLYKALVDSRAVVFKRRAAARAASFPYEKEMISAGIPFEESYLKFRLPAMMDEKKKFKMGKIPLPDSYYLMGTADPTGVLKDGEVCIILDNGQVSGKVLVYRNPGLHFGDIHILNAVYVKDMEDYVGNAKFGIFFPTQGPRSLADEMAGGDYDGDMFFVSRNPELLDSFKQDDRWVPPPSIKRIKKSKKVPVEMSDQELENELFMNFWNTRFNPSSTMGIAAESWQAMMDKLLISRCDGTYEQKKEVMEKKIKRLINVYYDALDAPKSGDEVLLPIDLKVNVFPHYMEKTEKGNQIQKCISTSILGAIYNEVKHYEERDLMPVTEIVKLPCFAERAPEHLLQKWTKHYNMYRFEMRESMKNEATKNDAAEGVNQQYREHFYGPTGDFHTSEKRKEELFEEARALYQVVYDYAESQRVKAGRDIAEQRNAIGKCSFAWKIAGTALCALYISSLGEKPMLCSESAWREMFG